MVEWSLFLGSSFPEVAEIISKGPSFELENSFIFRELSDTKFPEEFPTSTGQLLLSVLHYTKLPEFDLDRVEEVVRRIAPLNAPAELITDICNHLGRLGYPEASTLEAWVKAQQRQN